MARPKKTQPANGVVKIERGVPMPRRGGTQQKYPFRDMDIGDSFAVSDVSEAGFRSYASTVGKRLTRRFSIARVIEDGTRKLRAWRIA